MKKENARPKNVLAAFAAAPLGGAAVVAAITLVFGLFLAGWGKAAGGVAAMLFALTSIVGYAIGIVAGIPGYLLLRRLGWVSRVHWIALGAVLGAVAGAIWPLRVLLLNPDVTYGTAAVAALAIAGLLWGAASGLAFAWVIKVEPARVDKPPTGDGECEQRSAAMNSLSFAGEANKGGGNLEWSALRALTRLVGGLTHWPTSKDAAR